MGIMNFAPNVMQNVHIFFPKSASFVSSFSSFPAHSVKRSTHHRLVFGSSNSRFCTLNQASSRESDVFSVHNEITTQIHEDDGDGSGHGRIMGYAPASMVSWDLSHGSMESMSSNLDFFEHKLLGNWPERGEIDRIRIEQKAKYLGIPLSLRMIKRKQKWEEGFSRTEDFVFCSAKRAFSSLVLAIREIQSYTLTTRENHCSEVSTKMACKVQREMSDSFVWIFQQVFSKTPTLMVCVMILLANFTAVSVSQDVAVSATREPIPDTAVPLTETNNEEESMLDKNGGGRKLRRDCEIMSQEEVDLWKSVQAEALQLEKKSNHGFIDLETKRNFVTPITMVLEPEDYGVYNRTDLAYQMGLTEEPDNPLLLTNYAQFLLLVARDYNRAEECFKRAIRVEQPDAEALSRYADFLWIIRKDTLGAEERYLQAMAADPGNSSHASKYASFLWSTGGEETCFTL